jgi:ketosteroid isomerase-like protein
MSGSDQPAASKQQILQAMAQTNAIFDTEVFGKRNFAALNDIYTNGARILPPGSPMIAGREGIQEFWSGLITSTDAKSAVLETIDVAWTGEEAVEIGRATLSIEPEGQSPSKIEAKYVVHWKQEDGRWKWNIDIWNTSS